MDYKEAVHMNVKLITYDLERPAQNLELLLALIREFPSWKKLSDSSFAVTSVEDPITIYRNLKRVLRTSDQLFIFSLGQEHSGQASAQLGVWLDRNL